MKSFFGKKEEPVKEVAPKPKSVIFVRVMQGDFSEVVMEQFFIPVSEAVEIILGELKMPKKLENNLYLKYFLFRTSEYTADGWEILAETTTDGQPLLLSDYGIYKNARLELGAMVLKNAIINERNKNDEYCPDNWDDSDDEVTIV